MRVSVADLKRELHAANQRVPTELMSVHLRAARDEMENVQRLAAGTNSRLLDQNIEVIAAALDELDDAHDRLCQGWDGLAEYTELL
ncbi:hypothetical protein [Allokutzneria albata]|uniref:Uncharacterized protein n=1 Tax=Allokutzneria albata TaxID=211114 RepID=A0A1G9QUM3_ALLAB|nr:hypothetical protein [Allokutzneria albata]SDM14719.1 hypothetical protein SAMN04489726_0012 [Allokutzneria albata]SDN74300.1 hypothetical protein SAMN04489726_8023 [Allokutzneria albata]